MILFTDKEIKDLNERTKDSEKHFIIDEVLKDKMQKEEPKTNK